MKIVHNAISRRCPFLECLMWSIDRFIFHIPFLQTVNCSYVDICTLATGMNAFELLCNTDRGLPPPMDAVESLRQHLLFKESAGDLSDHAILTACTKQYISSDSEPSPIKWCLAKIFCATPEVEKSREFLHTLEKNLAKCQMIKVLAWLSGRTLDDAWSKLPVRGMIRWLKSNRSLLDSSDFEIIKNIEVNHRFSATGDELCEITGEPMTISPDGKCAVTESTKMVWPRCCFTFRALQGFHHLQSELSKARSSILDTDLQELLHGRCIYAGHPMI